MTLSLARALGPEIRVNTICPGFVAGEWLRQGLGAERYDNTLANLKKNNALAKVATPETVAQAIVGFLENADLVTGERSEERRVGKACVSTFRSRGSTYP